MGVLVLAMLSNAAWACPPPQEVAPFVVHADPEDTVAPLAPVVADLIVERGEEVYPGWKDVSCARYPTLGWLSVRFDQPVDDPHSRLDLGYRLHVRDGVLPASLGDAIQEGPEFQLWDTAVFEWTDLPEDQELMAFTLEVRAVDHAGNESPPLLVEVVADPVPSADTVATDPPVPPDEQSKAMACRSAPGAAGWPLALVALGLARLRKRRAASESR